MWRPAPVRRYFLSLFAKHRCLDSNGRSLSAALSDDRTRIGRGIGQGKNVAHAANWPARLSFFGAFGGRGLRAGQPAWYYMRRRARLSCNYFGVQSW